MDYFPYNYTVPLRRASYIIIIRARCYPAPARLIDFLMMRIAPRCVRGFASIAERVQMPPGLTAQTPLLESMPLSQVAQTKVLLKLETVQSSGSFKDRGMAYMCAQLRDSGVTSVICSSGGNAGHAVAAMGRRLGMSVKVIVPTTTKQVMLDKIRAQGAAVTVHGDNWNEADVLARQLVEADPLAEYIPPCQSAMRERNTCPCLRQINPLTPAAPRPPGADEHPLLWEGHSSIIDELADAGVKPGAIIASVGGGGLLNGLYLGLRRHGWDDVRVVSAETDGANCLAAAHAAGEPVRLDGITSVATSLGALQCSDTTLKFALEHPTDICTVSDAEALGACAMLLDEHRMLVEPACGAAVALLTAERYRPLFSAHDTVVAVVCGGSGVNLSIVDQWRQDGLWK